MATIGACTKRNEVTFYEVDSQLRILGSSSVIWATVNISYTMRMGMGSLLGTISGVILNKKTSTVKDPEP